jgi:hypothetical protein
MVSRKGNLMKKLLLAAVWLLCYVNVANAATKTYYQETRDSSGSVTAYFQGTTLMGFHLKDIKCDGKSVSARIWYGSSGYSALRNDLGCNKDRWFGSRYSGVRRMEVCRVASPQYCAEIYPQ